ncbi:chromosome segregation ATPase [Amorphus suaedae]
MDDRLSLLVTYGPIAGFVLAFLLALYWRAAARRARRRAERARPMALAEARAERDVHRAEHAVELRSLEQQLEEAKAQLGVARLAAARDNKLQHDLTRALERAVQAETAQNRLEREIADERARASDLAYRLEDREKEMAAQAARIAEAERQVEEARAEVRSAGADREAARAELETLRREKTEAATRIEALSLQISEIRSAQVSGEEVAALRSSLTKATEEHAAEKALRIEAERRFHERERDLEGHSAAIRDAENRAETLRLEAARTERALSEKTAALQEAEAARETAERQLRTMMNDGDHDRASAASAKARIDLLSQELSDLRAARVSGDEVAELRRSLGEANAALAEERARRVELDSTVRQLQAAAPAKKTSAKAAAAAAAAAEAAAASAPDGVAEELARIRQSLNEANNALAAEKSRRMALESDVVRLQREALEARATADAATEAMAPAASSAIEPKANGSEQPVQRAAQAASVVPSVAGPRAGPGYGQDEIDDLRHELERLRAENAALARHADGHGEMDRLETAVLRERLQDIAAEIAVVVARASGSNALLQDDGALPGESPDAIGSPDRDGPSLASRVRALKRRRAV